MQTTTRLQPTATLADLAVTHPGAARVFYRNGLDFCCGGQRSLADACAAKGLDPQAILAAIEAEDATIPESPRWHERPLSELVAHIVGFYHRRLRETLPDLRAMAEKVESRHADKASCPRGLAAHLEAIHGSVLDHLEKEEQILFPMILAGHGARAQGPIHVMELEHDDHRANLERTRALTADLTAPGEACTTWRALYLGLQQLEQELMEHIHLENNVLFPRALAS
jgi:regulator of cell morphogenesis and NO signaling